MTRSVIAALTGGVALVVLLLWFWLRTAEQGPHSAGVSPRPLSESDTVTAESTRAATEHDASRPPPAPEGATSPVVDEPGSASNPPTGPVPMSFIRRDYESEPRDAAAVAVERRIREIYAATPDAESVLRDVRCTRSVCRLDARWSPQLNTAYNTALVVLIKELSREVSFEPGGAPEGRVVPMALYIRRPVPALP